MCFLSVRKRKNSNGKVTDCFAIVEYAIVWIEALRNPIISKAITVNSASASGRYVTFRDYLPYVDLHTSIARP